MHPILTWQSVSKSYGSVKALDGFDLAVHAGEVFGLLGPNGAGKSTSLHLVCGLLAPDAGTVHVGDAEAGSREAKQRIGLAPQQLALYEHLTGRENVSFFARLYGLTGAVLRVAVDRALSFVNLSDRQHDRMGGYSGGMARRLNLAAAMVHDPAILMLDEPTAGVDPQSRNALFEHVLALKAQGRTVVYTTHYMEEVERLCDRVAIVDRGRVIALDTVPALVAAHGGPNTLIVQRGGSEERIECEDTIAALQQAVAKGGVEDFRTERPRLEQVFLHLTGRGLRD